MEKKVFLKELVSLHSTYMERRKLSLFEIEGVFYSFF